MTDPRDLFGEPPARDSRFDVKERWLELANYDEGDPRKEFEFLHRQMNEEINGLENSARCLTDFPEADWELRMWIARQCADEARHIVMFREIFEDRGGTVGQFPVINFQYRIISRIETLAGRLAVQNRSFEADGIDAIRYAADESRANGDDELAALFDAQLADEINHVRFANEWIHTLVKRQPILGLRIARALHDAAIAFAAAMEGGTAVTKYEVDETVRREAGFDAGEVAVAAQIAVAMRRGERAEG
jgi:uncharacterized ferritin-like protein (DUF455 family)